MQPYEKGPRRRNLRQAKRYEFRERWHRGFGHGLRPGTDADINCPSCQRDTASGKRPVITVTVLK